jgi:hypothetical protein
LRTHSEPHRKTADPFSKILDPIGFGLESFNAAG